MFWPIALTPRYKSVTENLMFRAVLLSMAVALCSLAEEHALVTPGDFWRVVPYTTNAVEPQPNWTQLDYNDSTWPLWRSSFVRLGIGVPGSAEHTFLPLGPTNFCFRKTFQVQDPNFVQWLNLRIDYE